MTTVYTSKAGRVSGTRSASPLAEPSGLFSALGQGVRMGLPVVFGYLPLGFAFGVLAVKAGIPAWGAISMSVFVLAGSGQLIAAAMIGAGTSVMAVVVANFLVNLRHILMGAALAPYLKPLPRWQRALFALEMTDEVFAVHSTAFRGGASLNVPRLFACNVTAHLGWIGGGALGVFSGGLVVDVRPWGLDFALPAMFLALLLPLCWQRLHLLVALLAGLLSVALSLAGVGKASVILATVVAACFGLFLSCRNNSCAPQVRSSTPAVPTSDLSKSPALAVSEVGDDRP